MSELRFNCPTCGQPLVGDSSYSGQRVTCPKCQAQVIVPPPVPGAAAAPGVPPLPGARPSYPPPPMAQQKTSGLAIASLVCSIGSFLIIPLGFIPGIICGHVAKKDLDKNPGLQGRGLATAGLIVGYIALAVHVLVLLAVLAFFGFAVHTARSGRPVFSSHRSSHAAPRAARPAEQETTDTGPDGTGWTLQLASVDTPAAPVTGRVHGEAFKLDKASLENGWLRFTEGQGFFPDRAMEVVLFQSDPAKLSGRTYTVPRPNPGITPHIYLKWKESGNDVPEQRSFVQRYAMRLEFGELNGDKLPGKIYLCLPDLEKSFLAGTFEAQVKGRP